MDDKLDDILKILQEIAQVLKDNNKNSIESLKKELIQDIYNKALDYLDDSIVYETDSDNHKSNAAGSADTDLEGYYSAKKCDLLTNIKNGFTGQHTMIKSKALNETMDNGDDNAELSCFRLDIDYKGHSEQTLDTDPIDNGSIDGSSAADVRQNEMKNSSSESNGNTLAKQKYTSTNENISVDSGSINEQSAVDVTQNEMKKSKSESGDRSLAKQQYRSTKENDSVDSGSINEPSAVDVTQNEMKNSKSESGDRSLTKQQYISTKENDSVDSGSINELSAAISESDGNALAKQTSRSQQDNNSTDKGSVYAPSFTDCEKNERKQPSKQSEKPLTEDMVKEDGVVDQSNDCTRRQNKIKFSNSDDKHGVSTNEKMEGKSHTCNGESRTSDSYSGQNKSCSDSDQISAIRLPTQIPFTHTHTTEKSREPDCYNANTAISEAKPKDIHKQVVEFTKQIQEKIDVNANVTFEERSIIHKQTDEFTKQTVEKESAISIALNGSDILKEINGNTNQNDVKAIEKGTDIKVFDTKSLKREEIVENVVISNSINNTVLCQHHRFSTGTPTYDRNLIFRKSDVPLVICCKCCQSIARKIGFPLALDDSTTIDDFFMWCKDIAEKQIRNIKGLKLSIYNNFSELGKYFSLLGIEQDNMHIESSLRSGGNKKYSMNKCQLEADVNEKQMRSPLPLLIMQNNISLFTLFGLDYISERNNRIEITMLLENFYCVQIAGHLNFNLSNNATFVDLLDCCHFVTNSHNKSLTDWMVSYECQVKLLVDSSKTLFDQRVQSMYTHALGDDMFTPDDRKGAFLRANQKLDCRKERKKGRSNPYEITISSDEYKSQPCQELVIHKNVSLDSGEFTSYRGRVRFMWSILLEVYRLYVFTCILLSIYIEELNADKMRHKIRTLFTQTNVVRAEYFELAMRESARIQVQLTFTHIHTFDNRIPTAVPIYRDGFLHRKDRCR